ncbi:unnamed protein product, partial [Allacma fusca]
VYTR